MFNAERLLGGLISNALGEGLIGRKSNSRRGGGLKSMAGGLISQNKAAIGMGLLGLAVAAYEHFTQNQNPQPSGNRPSSGGSTPVAPMPQASSGQSAHPALGWTPPPLPVNPGSKNEDALLLIRSMIAAANADHLVDGAERQAILGKVVASGLGVEEHSFMERELSNPLDLRALANQVKSREMAEQVYAASVLALEVDSDAERNYLQQLAAALNLDAATVAKWQK